MISSGFRKDCIQSLKKTDSFSFYGGLERALKGFHGVIVSVGFESPRVAWALYRLR